MGMKREIEKTLNKHCHTPSHNPNDDLFFRFDHHNPITQNQQTNISQEEESEEERKEDKSKDKAFHFIFFRLFFFSSFLTFLLSSLHVYQNEYTQLIITHDDE